MALLKAPPILEGKKTYILIGIFILGVVLAFTSEKKT